MSRGRHHRDRQCVGDIGRHQTIGRQTQWVQGHQHRHAEGAGTHRGHGHADPQQRPGSECERDFVPLRPIEPGGRKSQAQHPQGILPQERRRREREDHGAAAGNHLIEDAGRTVVEPKPDDDRSGGGDAADEQPSHDAPIDSSAEAERRGGDEFRARRKHEIGTHGHGRGLPEDEHQDGRHQRAAAHASEAHEGADNQAAESVEQGIGHRWRSVPGCRHRP